MKRANTSVGKVAFLFPGQGTIPDKSPPSSRVGERLFTLAERMGLSLREWVAAGSVDLLQRTESAQPAILIDSLAKAEALRIAGFEPDIVAGHSLGEYAALVVSGVLTPEEAFSVVVERGRLMAGVHGAMAAIVKLTLEEVSSICEQIEPQVVIANYNGPRQVVVSGREEGVNQAVELAREAGGRGIPLRVSGPFHSPLMGDAQAALASKIESIGFKTPSVPVISSVSGSVEMEPTRLKELLLTQITACVRWVDVVETLVGEEATDAVEVGVGEVLTGLGVRITSHMRFMTYKEALDG